METLGWATECACRTICGQLGAFVQDCCEAAWERGHKTEEHPHGILAKGWHEMRSEVEQHLNELKRLCWSGHDYGISYDGKADELWDMHQVIRKFRYDNILTEEQREMWCSGIADSPFHTSEQPLIKVTKKEE